MNYGERQTKIAQMEQSLKEAERLHRELISVYPLGLKRRHAANRALARIRRRDERLRKVTWNIK